MARKVGYAGKAPQTYTFKSDWHRHLGEGEKLLWSGVPVYGPRFTRKGLALSLVGALIVGYGVYQVVLDPGRYITNRSGAITDDELFISLAGSYLLFGHMVFDAVKRKFTRYALSNRRAFIIRWGRLDVPDIYPIGADTPVSITKGAADSVYFQREEKMHQYGGDVKLTGFRHITERDAVFDLLTDVTNGNYREKPDEQT